METLLMLLIEIVSFLLFINQIKLRKKIKSQDLALKGLRGFCADFTEAHSEVTDIFFQKAKKDYESLNQKGLNLYKQFLALENNIITRERASKLESNINGVAEYNIELANKIADLEKRLPKKKVTKKKVTRRK